MLIFFGIIFSGAIGGGLYYLSTTKTLAIDSIVKDSQDELQKKESLINEFLETYQKMAPARDFRVNARELNDIVQKIRAERGRLTITQAELEAVENRLRELDEIERELEASALETKEELAILEKKAQEIKEKNQALQDELESSMAEIDEMMKNLELTAKQQEYVDNMKGELASCQSQIDNVLIAIEQCNEQYVYMKKRYDALDIEYAQLYEKFTEAEAMFE